VQMGLRDPLNIISRSRINSSIAPPPLAGASQRDSPTTRLEVLNVLPDGPDSAELSAAQESSGASLTEDKPALSIAALRHVIGVRCNLRCAAQILEHVLGLRRSRAFT
jgi:hypothetical protein